MNQLTTPLLNFVWQGTVIAAGLWLALLFAKSSRTRYALAAATLLVMALAPLVTYWSTAEVSPGLERFAAEQKGRLMIRPGSDNAEYATLAYLWLAGVALCSLRVVRAAWATRMLQVDAREVPNPCPALFDRAVRIVESARVTVPAQLGVFKPVILLPLGLMAQLPPEHLEAILAHELAHIRRHDYLVNLLQVLVETLLFYHPGVWWVSSVMRREREHCADDLALELVRDPHAYASALLTLEEQRQQGWALAANDGVLKTRIERVLTGGAPQRGSVLPALLVLVLAAGYATMLRAQVAPPPAQEAPDQEIAELKGRILKLEAELARRHGAVAVRLAEAEQKLAAEFDAEARKHHAELLRQSAAVRKTEAELKAEAQEQQAELLAQQADAGKELAARTRQQQLLRQSAAARQMEADLRLAAERAERFDAEARKQQAELLAQQADAGKKLAAERLEQAAQATQTEHERRIQYADKRWSTKDVKGSATPRGQVYIQEGPPDELEIYKDKSEAWRYRSPERIVRFDAEGKLVK